MLSAVVVMKARPVVITSIRQPCNNRCSQFSQHLIKNAAAFRHCVLWTFFAGNFAVNQGWEPRPSNFSDAGKANCSVSQTGTLAFRDFLHNAPPNSKRDALHVHLTPFVTYCCLVTSWWTWMLLSAPHVYRLCAFGEKKFRNSYAFQSGKSWVCCKTCVYWLYLNVSH